MRKNFNYAEGDTQVKVTTTETPKDTSTPTTTVVVDTTKKEKSFFQKHKVAIMVGTALFLSASYYYLKIHKKK